MKALILGGVLSLASALVLSAQTPAELSPTPTPAPAATFAPTPPSVPVTTATPTVTIAIMPAATLAPAATAATAAPTTPNAFAEDIKRKAHGKSRHGVHIDLGDDEDFKHVNHGDAIPDAVVPIVFFSLFAVFGTPVAIVAVIMFMSWAKARSLHRTVREMVAKGQPVPPELLAARVGGPLRPWYDLRRGIILLAVGTGIVVFFGVSAGWDVGVWALGLIPAIIGGGYIIAWRLAQKQENGFKM